MKMGEIKALGVVPVVLLNFTKRHQICEMWRLSSPGTFEQYSQQEMSQICRVRRHLSFRSSRGFQRRLAVLRGHTTSRSQKHSVMCWKGSPTILATVKVWTCVKEFGEYIRVWEADANLFSLQCMFNIWCSCASDPNKNSFCVTFEIYFPLPLQEPVSLNLIDFRSFSENAASKCLNIDIPMVNLSLVNPRLKTFFCPCFVLHHIDWEWMEPNVMHLRLQSDLGWRLDTGKQAWVTLTVGFQGLE